MNNANEVILVSLTTTGAKALFVNGDAILTREFDDPVKAGERPEEVGLYLARSLGVALREVAMEAPSGDEWSWNDVYAQIPPTVVFEPVSDAPTMLVSLDGGVSYAPAPNGVRIIYQGVMIDGEDGRGEVHINASTEGLITDIWMTRDQEDHNVGTDSVGIDDIVSRLVAEND